MIASVRSALLALATTAAVCAAGAAVPVEAQADAGPGQTCAAGNDTQPFAPWGDNSSYELAPSGDFETDGWSLTRGAARVAGSEPFAATGTLGSYSLSLPAGGSATSPTTCIGVNDPTFRFFVAGSGLVLAQVVYQYAAIPVGVVSAGASWASSRVLLTGSGLFGGLSGGSTQVALRFTALSGDPQIDDVFIDPWNRH